MQIRYLVQYRWLQTLLAVDKILFILASYSVAFLVADAKIFKAPRQSLASFSPRFFGEFITCYFCLGIWAGPVVYALLAWNYDMSLHLCEFILAALVASTSIFVLDLSIKTLEKRI